MVDVLTLLVPAAYSTDLPKRFCVFISFALGTCFDSVVYHYWDCCISYHWLVSVVVPDLTAELSYYLMGQVDGLQRRLLAALVMRSASGLLSFPLL